MLRPWRGFFVARSFSLIAVKAASLLFRIVQFAESVPNLQAADEHSKRPPSLVRRACFWTTAKWDRKVIQIVGWIRWCSATCSNIAAIVLPGDLWIVRHVRRVAGVQALHQFFNQFMIHEVRHLRLGAAASGQY